VNITIKSSASESDVARLKAAVEDRCPVSDNISSATPVKISMQAA
jgi:uncharacterized OsmC-like protein